jgi:hypothetical protein
MTKEAIKLLDACLPKADNIDAFLASAEEQTEDDLKNMAKADPIECIFSCDACPDFNCVCNLAN